MPNPGPYWGMGDSRLNTLDIALFPWTTVATLRLSLSWSDTLGVQKMGMRNTNASLWGRQGMCIAFPIRRVILRSSMTPNIQASNILGCSTP